MALGTVCTYKLICIRTYNKCLLTVLREGRTLGLNLVGYTVLEQLVNSSNFLKGYNIPKDRGALTTTARSHIASFLRNSLNQLLCLKSASSLPEKHA